MGIRLDLDRAGLGHLRERGKRPLGKYDDHMMTTTTVLRSVVREILHDYDVMLAELTRLGIEIERPLPQRHRLATMEVRKRLNQQPVRPRLNR